MLTGNSLDIRIFPLLRSPVEKDLPELGYTWKTCEDAPCVEVELGDTAWSFSFTWDEDSWILSGIDQP